MYISARERQILEILLSTKDELTVKDLADEIHVSVRTVHRDLKNVEDILAEYDLTLLKKSGVGIQVAGSEQKVNELQFFCLVFRIRNIHQRNVKLSYYVRY
ncbi:HTH domain-containing protein [Ectobacillus funiculus]